jgi:uncharacterized protein (TIGR02611 family)
MAKLSVPDENVQVSPGGDRAESADGEESDIDVIEPEISKTSTIGRLDIMLASIRRTPAGRLGLKVGIGVVGAIVVAGGLVLVPLPGPGWLIVFAGLAIWSIEFRWAKRLNRYARDRVSAWTTWYGEQGWLMRIAIGAALLVLVVAAISAATYLSFGAAPFHRLGL